MLVVAFGKDKVSVRATESHAGAPAPSASTRRKARAVAQSAAPAKSTSVTEPRRGLASAKAAYAIGLALTAGSALPDVPSTDPGKSRSAAPRASTSGK